MSEMIQLFKFFGFRGSESAVLDSPASLLLSERLRQRDASVRDASVRDASRLRSIPKGTRTRTHTLRERQLLVMSLILLATIRLGLWLLPFRTLLKLLTKISQPSNAQITNSVTAGKIVWAVNAVSRYMPGVKCLARALTAQVLMNRHRLSPQLRIGVAKTERGKLEAHAWVEYQGKVAIGNLADLSRFIPLPSLEGVKL